MPGRCDLASKSEPTAEHTGKQINKSAAAAKNAACIYSHLGRGKNKAAARCTKSESIFESECTHSQNKYNMQLHVRFCNTLRCEFMVQKKVKQMNFFIQIYTHPCISEQTGYFQHTLYVKINLLVKTVQN
jgi:hypothetical protein